MKIKFKIHGHVFSDIGISLVLATLLVGLTDVIGRSIIAFGLTISLIGIIMNISGFYLDIDTTEEE